MKDGFALSRTACSPATTRASATTTSRRWDYEIGADGFVVVDDTLQHPRCVWNLLKQHVARYTPEMVERICGTPKDKFLKICRDDRRRRSSPDQGDDLDVRARLDAAFEGLAEHPHAWRWCSSSWAISACAAAA